MLRVPALLHLKFMARRLFQNYLLTLHVLWNVPVIESTDHCYFIFWYHVTFYTLISFYYHDGTFCTKGAILYIPWCIASYYIIKIPNACDPISSTGTWQLKNSGKLLVLPIKLSVPLLCRSIYDFRLTIPNISLVKSKRVYCPPIMS